MLHLFVEPKIIAQLHNAAVDPRSDKAAFQQIVEQVAVLTFLPLNDRCEDQESSSVGQPSNTVNDLLGRLSSDRSAALRAMTLADSCEQHAEIIEDFRNRADGRARVASAG